MAEPDPRAWLRDALDQFEGPLLRYAAHLTHDADLARDVVQDTFLRLCNEPAASVNGHLAAWLFAVCRNRAIDVRKKERRMKTMADTELTEHAGAAPSPAGVLEAADSAASILRLLATLPENQQEVVRLKFQHSLSYKEIASVTKLSVTNVGFLIHTALKTIRERLHTGGDSRRTKGRSS